MGFAEHIRLTLEPPGELLEIVFIDCLEKLGHADRLLGAAQLLPGLSVLLGMFRQVVDEAASSTPFLHAQPERGVELDTTVEKGSSHCPMVEPAGQEERSRHRGGVITGVDPRCVKATPHTVVVTQCRQSIEATRQNTLARKELQYSLGTGANCVLPYRRVRNGPSVQEKLGAFEACEHLLPVRVAAIAKRAGGEPEQRLSGIAAPR